MGLLSGAIAAAAPAIIRSVIGEVSGLAEKYLNKEISKEEYEARKVEAMSRATAEVEQAWASAAPEIYQSAMDAVVKNRIVRWVWASTAVSQLLVILWHQIGIPAYVHLTGGSYPSSGDTFEYAYLLLAACIGVGPIVMKGRSGPGGGVLDQILKQ